MSAASAGPPPGSVPDHGPDHRGDGDGWVECAQGHRHWGRFGAAGLLVNRTTGDPTREVLLQHRVEWSHHGGTWGVPGGARASTESAVTAALREAAEEAAVDRDAVQVAGRYDDDHGGWSYVTVLAAAGPDLAPRATGRESLAVAWHPVERVEELPLHPGFALTWPLLRPILGPVDLVVDAANVMGSRPDGWWRDRAGAAARLAQRCAALVDAGVPGSVLPAELGRSILRRCWPRVHLVLEGAARPAGADVPAGVDVVIAPREGDDAIVATVRQLGGTPVVVTADRELRRRCEAVGARPVGPRWLLDLLDGLDAGDLLDPLDPPGGG